MTNKRKQKNCLNCGFAFKSTLKANFCPECGQQNTLRKAKLITLIQEFLADFVLFDSKIFKSWLFLLFRPGFLTKVYNQGKRVRYISPIRLFLFSGVIFFFILSFLLRDINWSEQTSFNSNPTQKKGFTLKTQDKDGKRKEIGLTLSESESSNSTSNSLFEMAKTMSAEEIIDSLGLENPFNQMTTRQLTKLIKNQGADFSKYAFNNLSLAILCMQPFVAFILGLLYYRRQLFFVDHLIFSLHQHAFIYTFFGFFALILSQLILLPSLAHFRGYFTSLFSNFHKSGLPTRMG